MMPQTGEVVFVETAARLHFGVLDLRGARGRWFGGIGTAAPAPTLLLSASAGDTIEVEGDDAARAAACATRFLRCHGLGGGATIRIERALPSHAGLGSGTQLALSVARALAELYGIDTEVSGLARAVGRTRRSAVGLWTFAGGGLVVEGGRPRGLDANGPLLVRIPFPASWRCVVVVPNAAPAISGAEEAAAFARLPPAPEREVEQLAHLVLMGLLPSLAESDLPSFGAALSEMQRITGRWWASVQGSMFAPGPSEEMVRRLAQWGASGVGQSSWGPTVYGIVDSEAAAAELADRARHALGGAGTVYEGPFRAEGARVWRAPRRT
jgi:beta-RFAP synthase